MRRVKNVFLRIEFFFRISSFKKRNDELLKILHDFTDSVILSRRDELMKNNNSNTTAKGDEDVGAKKKMAFLDILLQSTIEGQPLSNMDIREEVDTFMFEGHDTTSSGIAFCLYNLAKYPEIQQKAFEEIRNVMGDDLKSPATLTILNDLNYLEMVIKESLRLYPSVPMFGRRMPENVELSQ
jgi:cytochrome P450 family 4